MFIDMRGKRCKGRRRTFADLLGDLPLSPLEQDTESRKALSRNFGQGIDMQLILPESTSVTRTHLERILTIALLNPIGLIGFAYIPFNLYVALRQNFCVQGNLISNAVVHSSESSHLLLDSPFETRRARQ